MQGAQVVLGVSGGIAAYKAVDLASKLVQAGASVDVILTEAGTKFVGPASFEAITKRPVHTDVFETWSADWLGHISLGQNADIFVVAPATANTIAKLALGIADDMLGSAALASTAPLLLAPAMEHEMYHHAATQESLAIIRRRGGVQVGPEKGRLASGDAGDGRMAEPLTILGAIRWLLGSKGPLAGRKVVVTAGGTQEPLDPIRFIGNRSSGMMGYAVAQALIDQGALVTLVSGPTSLQPPYSATVVSVTSAAQMMDAVVSAIDDADALVMTAAVSDYRPAARAAQKIKKGDAGATFQIELIQNPDILDATRREGLVRVGFAAETTNLVAYAQQKLAAKELDMIVANDAEATIGQPNNAATLIFPNNVVEPLPRMPKPALAAILVERVIKMLDHR